MKAANAPGMATNSVAATATHGRRGALTLSAVAGAAVLGSRMQLIASGAMPFEVRHITDAVFYTVFFAVTSAAALGWKEVWFAIGMRLVAGVVFRPPGRITRIPGASPRRARKPRDDARGGA